MIAPVHFLRDLLFPPYARCLLCGDVRLTRRDHLCAACRKKLEDSRLSAPVCRRCGHPLEADGCPFCAQGRMEGIFRMTAPFVYKDEAAKLVRLLKYQGFEEAGEVLGMEMAHAFQAAKWPKPDRISFVPMPRLRELQRGGNHGECLALICGELLALPVEGLLKRTRSGAQQAKLNKAQRQVNLHGAFSAVKGLDGQRILLVDDVVTTGATARECARTLLTAGAKQVMVLAACMA